MPDIPISKDLSRDYSPRTIVAYRSRLKTLKLGLEVGAISEQDKPAALREIAVLEAKLGDRAVSPGQGRPRKYVKLTMAEVEALKEGKEVDLEQRGYYSEAQQAIRREVKQKELIEKGALEESEAALNAMKGLITDDVIAKAQEEKFNKEVTKDEGPKTTDDAKAPGGNTGQGQR